MGLWGVYHRRGRGGQQSSCECLIFLGRDSREKITKIEAHAGMSERLVRDLVIEEDIKTEIKINTRTQKSFIC